VVVNDSLIAPYYERHREDFSYPDRIGFTAIYSPNTLKAETVLARLRGGESMESVFEEDSVRNAKPRNFRVLFKGSSFSVNKTIRTTLEEIAADLKSDAALRLSVTARPDTLTGKSKALTLASRRLETIQKYLEKRLNVTPKKVTTFTVPVPSMAQPDSTRGHVVDFLISGREPLVVGKVEHGLAAPQADERAKYADSLSQGSFSSPFAYRGMYAIVRIDGRESARLKTFEEAGPEVASAYQEFESKRLENEWLAQLRRDFPVVENTSVLKEAFAPKK
jgi:hypothetical protein